MEQTNYLNDKNFSDKFLRNSMISLHRISQSNKSMLDTHKVDLNKVKVAPSVISFQYRGGYNQYLYNRDLRIVNNSGGKICFKIKANNPQSYEVFPFKETIENDRSCEIRIKLLVTSRKPQKYNDDQFLVILSAYDEKQHIQNPGHNFLSSQYTNKNPQKFKRHTLHVKIQYEKISHQIQSQKIKEQKQLEMYKQILKQNLKEIIKLDKQIKQRENVPHKDFTINKTMLFIVSLAAFFVGYYIV